MLPEHTPFILRRSLDRQVNRLFLIPALLIPVIVAVIALVLFLRSLPVMATATLPSLLLSSVWRPMAGEFGFFPFIMGSVIVSILAMVLAIPVSLLSAIYLSEFATPAVRRVLQPSIEILAGVPSVIFGLFGVLVVVPFIRDNLAPALHSQSTGYCVLAGGIILAMMVFPLLISVMTEVFSAVPAGMREASLACGATRWEMVKHVTLRAGLAGIAAAVILAFARAFGETMAVLMVVGNVVQVPGSVLDPAYPIPALIANNYGEMMSIPLYDSALLFSALILFLVLIVFIVLTRIVLDRVKLRVIL
ncbi:MAG: phosphate ABC transporter permease subunit PstC [Methanoregula sp.]|jgi:phosphate transport system permease protein